jgi:hypothetical protein
MLPLLLRVSFRDAKGSDRVRGPLGLSGVQRRAIAKGRHVYHDVIVFATRRGAAVDDECQSAAVVVEVGRVNRAVGRKIERTTATLSCDRVNLIS